MTLAPLRQRFLLNFSNSASKSLRFSKCRDNVVASTISVGSVVSIAPKYLWELTICRQLMTRYVLMMNTTKYEKAVTICCYFYFTIPKILEDENHDQLLVITIAI